MRRPCEIARRRAGRAGAGGLWVLAAIVVAGLGIPAFFRWSVPRLETRAERIRAAAPQDAEGRLALWLRYGRPAIHHALQMARFSDERPWYVTHVAPPAAEGEPPAIYGIELVEVTPENLRAEGLAVELVVPAPRLLARDVLVGDKALGVPVVQAGPDEAARIVKARLERYLERIATGLEEDIPGATLRVVVEE